MKFPAIILSLFLLTGISYHNESPDSTKAEFKPFEGTIVYDIEYIEVPEEVQGMESMLPQTTSMSISGDLVRVEQEVMGGTQVVIVDNLKKESHILMNMMGQKIDIFLTKEEIEAAEAEAGTNEMEVKELDGKKTILGYKCKQALLIDPETGDSQEVYYTKKLEIAHKDFKSLRGFPLEYYTTQESMKIKMTASEIKAKKLDASLFKVPPGYQQMSMDELNKLAGGN